MGPTKTPDLQTPRSLANLGHIHAERGHGRGARGVVVAVCAVGQHGPPRCALANATLCEETPRPRAWGLLAE
eukprot:8710378-Lingulodinium_polyedra.AAC.1